MGLHESKIFFPNKIIYCFVLKLLVLILENLRGKKKTKPSLVFLMPEILTSKKKAIVYSIKSPFSKQVHFELNVHLNLRMSVNSPDYNGSIPYFLVVGYPNLRFTFSCSFSKLLFPIMKIPV